MASPIQQKFDSGIVYYIQYWEGGKQLRMVVQFHQNGRGFKAGMRYTVVGRVPGVGVMMSNMALLPLGKPDRFNVFRMHEKDTELKKGDTIRITANGKSAKGQAKPFLPNREHALNNGATYKVAGFTLRGDIRLENGWIVATKFAHFTHGYCSTSRSSQLLVVSHPNVSQPVPTSSRRVTEQFDLCALQVGYSFLSVGLFPDACGASGPISDSLDPQPLPMHGLDRQAFQSGWQCHPPHNLPCPLKYPRSRPGFQHTQPRLLGSPRRTSALRLHCPPICPVS